MEEIVDLDSLMDCIERAFKLYEDGAYQMPDRMHVDRPEGTILYMPCFTNEVSGTKIVSTFPENIKAGIPSIQGTMILNKSKTGETLAIMDGAMITAYRTGAVGGVGVRHTTRENCKRLGLVGTGVQGFFQVLYACAARPIEEIYIFDSDIARAQDFKDRLGVKLLSVTIHIVENAVELVQKSEIIITATPSTTPVLPDDEELLRGRHIIAIGSYKYEMRELPPALYRILDAVYIDTELAAEESGDLIVPLEEGWMQPEDYKVFGKAYRELVKMPKTQVRTTLYKSVGMALFDLLVAEAIYQSAVAKGLGVDLGE
ncbi:MAG: ornithine cyclodeaminase family protein [Desulfopila sp.]|jgi:ornithine cyclodeaminase|nr:ornithine cyclodeaminase family protein [Desulfopila sp.]